MNRYAIAILLFAAAGSPAFGQSPDAFKVRPEPISGGAPPWAAPNPKGQPPFVLAPSPSLVRIPAGDPLVGYYKMDGVLVGADNRYPFDSGEFSLGGLEGNARIFGNFEITLPIPQDIDPLNQPIAYKYLRKGLLRGGCNRGTCK